jgi:hypothetical protein
MKNIRSVVVLLLVIVCSSMQVNAQGSGDTFLGIRGGTFVSSLKNKG